MERTPRRRSQSRHPPPHRGNGRCFTFNYGQYGSSTAALSLVSRLSGSERGLLLILDSQPSEDLGLNFFTDCCGNMAAGLLLIVHEPVRAKATPARPLGASALALTRAAPQDEQPDINDAILIAPRMSTDIRVLRRSMRDEPPPYTDCYSVTAPEYSYSACLKQCVDVEMLNNCGCVEYQTCVTGGGGR